MSYMWSLLMKGRLLNPWFKLLTLFFQVERDESSNVTPWPSCLRLQNDKNDLMKNTWSSDSVNSVKTFTYSFHSEQKITYNADINHMRGSLYISSHVVKICHNPKFPIMNRWVTRVCTWKDLKRKEMFYCIKINSKHAIWLTLTQPCMSKSCFLVQPTKNSASLLLHNGLPHNLPEKGHLTCHAADVHQPPLGFPKKRQKCLRDFHSPKEVHSHAVFVVSHGNELPINGISKDPSIVDHSPQSWE